MVAESRLLVKVKCPSVRRKKPGLRKKLRKHFDRINPPEAGKSTSG